MLPTLFYKPTGSTINQHRSQRMKAPSFISLVLVLFASSAGAQTITDGDTLKQGGVTYRLWGIDAPEAKQVCRSS